MILNQQKLVEYGHKILKQPGTLWTLKSSKLDGGYAPADVYRHDLVFRLTDDNFETLSVVQKFTIANEVRVMHALSQMPAIEAVPLTIDYAIDTVNPDERGNNWFIIPFYDGTFLTFEDQIPVSIIRPQGKY